MISATVSSKYTKSDRSIDLTWTGADLRQKLEQITGIPPAAQDLVVSMPTGQPLNIKFLDSDCVKNCLPANVQNISILVEDSRPVDQQFSVDESVEKYEMSDAKYQQRTGSVLQWKKANHLGRFAEKSHDNPLLHDDESFNIPIHSRVSVTLQSGQTPTGTVKFIGKIPEIPGNKTWIGVALDSPVGKNDGTVKDHRYFDCQPNYGVFVKPSTVQTVNDRSDDEI